MTKVSINLDIPANLYDEVVYPKKMDKKFNALMVDLLRIYHENSNVQALVDGGPADNAFESVLDNLISQANDIQMNLEEDAAMLSSAGESMKNGEYIAPDTGGGNTEGISGGIDDARLTAIERKVDAILDALGGGVKVPSEEFKGDFDEPEVTSDRRTDDGADLNGFDPLSESDDTTDDGDDLLGFSAPSEMPDSEGIDDDGVLDDFDFDDTDEYSTEPEAEEEVAPPDPVAALNKFKAFTSGGL